MTNDQPLPLHIHHHDLQPPHTYTYIRIIATSILEHFTGSGSHLQHINHKGRLLPHEEHSSIYLTQIYDSGDYLSL